MVLPTTPTRRRRIGSGGSSNGGGMKIKLSWILFLIIGISVMCTVLLNGQFLSNMSKVAHEQKSPAGRPLDSALNSFSEGVESSERALESLWNTVTETTSDFSSSVLSSASFIEEATTTTEKCDGGLIPYDLNVNHLHLIEQSKGASPDMVEYLSYDNPDFLPVVVPNDEEDIQFRFRLKPKPGSNPDTSIRDITAYQIQVTTLTKDKIVWDSGKVEVDTFPQSIPLEDPWTYVKSGNILQWRVKIWDYTGQGTCTSEYTKFAIGPQSWEGKWVINKDDASEFQKAHDDPKASMHFSHSYEGCQYWKQRRPLPLIRSRIFDLPTENKPPITSALLVASGLGYFAVSLNGKRLSSSSLLDPPTTDFSQRVSYRGYDVTKMLDDKQNVIGIELGSGWWDGRPLNGGLIGLNMMPRGPLMAIAQLHITYEDGTTAIVSPSSPLHGWESTKGYILDADLVTGDTWDLAKFEKFKGWDTPTGVKGQSGELVWSSVETYKPDATRQEWRATLHNYGVNRAHPRVNFRSVEGGTLVASTAPPVLPQERLEPESVVSLGDGRWLYDFGKAFSGVVRFEDGLPVPLTKEHKPGNYPRGHFVDTPGDGDAFVTVVYGDSIYYKTGDINLMLVAAMGLHDCDGNNCKPPDVIGRGGPCYPKDHNNTLTQRDVFIVPQSHDANKVELFEQVRQARFTSHGFRFAEVCCTAEPPKSVHAVAYQTSFEQRGQFDSSNVNLNGAWELVLNAFKSNILGTQTDCPHRERLQYGGDIMANSPASLHMFDLSAFYNKVIKDWIDTQWDNGAYTETSIFQNLNGHLSIGKGSGETVWASLPAILSVRHMQYYGDKELLSNSLEHHIEWLEFMKGNWEAGMKVQFGKYPDITKDYGGDDGGLGDWLSMQSKDSWLTHHSYYMSVARAIAYITNQIGIDENQKLASTQHDALVLSYSLRQNITEKYSRNGLFRLRDKGLYYLGPSADLGIFTKIVEGPNRCSALRGFIKVVGSGSKLRWPGSEEKRFYDKLNKKDLEEGIATNQISKSGDSYQTVRMHRHSTPEGILSLRYTLKALSDNGFHNIALTKVSADLGCPSFAYMLSHNATTMWETWWRSEDFTSRNHPMFGAVGEWLSSSVAGISMSPTTVGAKQILFWPRIPTNALVVKYASAIQGTQRGESAIAWQFLNLGDKLDQGSVQVQIRILIPPATRGMVRLPKVALEDTSIRHSLAMPDLDASMADAKSHCQEQRKTGNGYHYNWEFDREKQEWYKVQRGRAIGTPCASFLFDARINMNTWSEGGTIPTPEKENLPYWEFQLESGMYDIVLDNYKFEEELPDTPGYEKYDGDMGGLCAEERTFEWSIDDATHII